MQSLERRLGLFSIITISISSMVGAGIFILPGIGFQATGPSLALSFLLAAVCILPAAASKAELATAMPTSGGTYIYLERTFGPLAGTVAGLGLFLSILLKASFSLIGIGAYFSIFSSLPLMPTIMGFLTLICLLNIFGVGKVSSFLTIILFITITSLVLLVLFSFPQWNPSYMTPLLPKGLSGLTAATGLVFVSYAGVTKVAAIAEEIKNPELNLPRGILLSLAVVAFIYSATSFTLANIFPMEEIAGKLTPIYMLAERVGGSTVGLVVAVIAVLTMGNTANAGVLAGSRFPFAMSRDHLLPGFIGKIHKKFLTPVFSIILSCLIIACILLTMDVGKIAKFASAFMILIYMLENVAVIVLRESRAEWYTPQYRSPLYPMMQVCGIIASLVLLFAMGPLAITAIVAIAVPGILLFFLYSRNRTTRKGVLGIRGKRTDLFAPDPTRTISIGFNQDARVVVSLFGKERSPEMLVEMGVAMAEHNNLEVVRIMEIPEQTAADDLDEPAETRSLRRRIAAMSHEKNEPIIFDSVVSHDVPATVFEISQRLHCLWMFVEWKGRSAKSITFHNPIGWLKSHLHCHLATFKDSGVRYIRKIMVVLRNDANDSLALDTAEHLAEVNRAYITLMKFCQEKSSPEQIQHEETFLKNLSNRMKVNTDFKLVVGRHEVASFITESVNHDLLILGSSDYTFMNRFRGSFDDKLIAKAECSVLAVHKASFSTVRPH